MTNLETNTLLQRNSNFSKQEYRKIKQDYKAKMETSLDNVVRLFNNAKQNRYDDFRLGEEFKSPILRYYKNFWLSKLIFSLLIMMFVIFASSFYYYGESTFLIVVSFMLIFSFSEKIFLRLNLRFFELSKNEKDVITNKIFTKRTNIFMIMILPLMILISMFSLFFVSFDIEIPSKIIDFLEIGNLKFKPQNLAFAITNASLVCLLLIYAVVKKYKV
ncbi:MAG: hypothetical protein PHS78_06400 [Aliarcobacter skirrowii]|uniref:hypothetical protein n=1 Tax=Aliarcobacter skirrowii TaxID=28200 RepID=UPI00242C81DD|nr:hypothetical protein [Aliarcobacter skirrowii]MDD2508653.1 hypothetical protein [Aliarcobacter skirrowii]MDD3496865.1 hypothetical protein [Aliarcobacter skirrowii]